MPASVLRDDPSKLNLSALVFVELAVLIVFPNHCDKKSIGSSVGKNSWRKNDLDGGRTVRTFNHFTVETFLNKRRPILAETRRPKEGLARGRVRY